MSFGYPVNTYGQNSPTQIRRSVDTVYQRGGTYEVILTGTTYEDSMELLVDLYNKDIKVGQMAIVPYDISLSGSTYYYKFGIRPYDYMSNYIESQHYTKYRYFQTNGWRQNNEVINANTVATDGFRNTYRNITRANYKYGYRYYSGTTLVTEYTGSTPTNNLQHTWQLPFCNATNGEWSPTQCATNGNYFNYIGGQLQMDEHLILPNFDQEMGTALSLNNTSTMTLGTDYERIYSPASQFIFDYPRTPYQSERSRFLTDAPRIQYIGLEEGYNLYYLQGQTGDRKVIEANYVVFNFYDENDTLLSKNSYPLIRNTSGYGTFRAPTGFTDTLDVWSLPCGPEELRNMTVYNTTLEGWSGVTYYTAQVCSSYPTDSGLEDTIGPVVPVSEKFYFYIKKNCLPQNTRLAWLNNRGGYDYYTFTAYRQDTKKITRQTYDSRLYTTTVSSPDRDMGRTIKTFATDIEQEIVLETDFLSVPIADWLQQLFYSPQVYLMKNDYIPQVGPNNFNNGVYYKDLTPTQVLSTEVETITKKHQKLNKYRITMKVANNFFVNKGF
jgi:hypothetical protein